MTTEQILPVLRIVWTVVFGVLTPVAFWNAKEALLDYWAHEHAPNLNTARMPTFEALKHTTRGSAYVQCFAFACLLCGLSAGLFSIGAMGVAALISIILLGVFLGALTIFEAARRSRVTGALKRRRPTK